MMKTLAERVIRSPFPYDAVAGRAAALDYADLGPQGAALVAGIAGCSPYLYGLISRDPEGLRQMFCHPPEALLETILTDLDAVPLSDLPSALRRAKVRVALLAGLCDAAGAWPLEAVTGALTRLADRAVDLSLRALVADEMRRGKLPTSADAGGMFALAMGKMGAGELNYSSDIDLICLFDESRYKGAELDARAAFIRVARKMALMLSESSAEGYVFRTDLRLRPDASVTPVCISMAAAEQYYESEGRTWERAAYIKARPCGGDLAAGERFLQALRPFVWRKHLDFAAIQDAHDMRLRIRDHRGLHGPITVEGHNLKLGAGGIREIEFYAQTRQLIAGGRDNSLRARGTVAALAALAEKGWVSGDDAHELTQLYRAHREIEHRLQMVNDAQTHSMPTTAEGVARIAAFCGQDEVVFRRDLLTRLQRTNILTDGFFAPKINDVAYDLSPESLAIVKGWLRYPALRSARAQVLLERIKPQLLAQLSRAAKPDEALQALDGFLSKLPAGVQLFALFEANPILIELIVDIVASAPRLAAYLSRNAAVLDAVIGGSFWKPWPGMRALRHALSDHLAPIADYEEQLNAARRWLKEWHFRVGVHHLRGLIDASEAAKSYADLAEAVIGAIWAITTAQFTAKHGPQPGRGAAVMAMGSLGVAQLNAASDLDLIVIYDALGQEESQGPKPLATRSYFARLTQALLTALTAQTSEGRLYDVDMRLRPSGRQGPVATSLQSFIDYQEAEAWSWEHLALTRARVLLGAPDLMAHIEDIRQGVLARKGQGQGLISDIAEMRGRLFAAKPPRSVFDAKNGPGGLMDIELFAQTLAMQSKTSARGVERQLIAAQKAGKLEQADCFIVLSAYRMLWPLHAAARLLTDHPLDLEQIGEGARSFVLRQMGADGIDVLAQSLDHKRAQALGVIAGYFH